MEGLLLQTDEMYHQYMHGIQEIEEDLTSASIVNNCDKLMNSKSLKRQTRISLTFRHVLLTKKITIKLSR